jgi:Domain of unknown function (DUF4440)
MSDGGTDEAGSREAVIAAEHERCRAVSQEDWNALDALLDDSLTHTHMNGRVDTKQALLANLRARPRTLTRGPLQVHIYGEAAVMTGPQFLDLGAGATQNQATETWIRRGDRWVLVAFHASTGDPTSPQRID